MKSSSYQSDSIRNLNDAACLDSDSDPSTNLLIDIDRVELLLEDNQDFQIMKVDQSLKMMMKKTSKNHSQSAHAVNKVALKDQQYAATSQDSIVDLMTKKHKMKVKQSKIGRPIHERKRKKSDSNEELAMPASKQAKLDKLETVSLTTAETATTTAIHCRNVHNVKINTNAAEMSTAVEPDLLGPCDPGTAINLDGIVWLETSTGMLVVNVTWRGRTYVGTLLDSSQHEFAPPSPKRYESPMDQAARNQPRRGRRRAGVTSRNTRSTNRLYLTSTGSANNGSCSSIVDTDSDGSVQTLSLKHSMFKCPQPNCSKRFPDVLALKFHHNQTHCRKSSTSPQLTATIEMGSSVSVFKMPTEISNSNVDEKSANHCGILATSSSSMSALSTFLMPEAFSGQHKLAHSGKNKSSRRDIENHHAVACPTPSLSTSLAKKSIESKAIHPLQGSLSTPSVEDEVKNKTRIVKNSSLPCQLKGKRKKVGKSEQLARHRDCSRKPDNPASPAYSDISDGSPAPVLEKETELSKTALPLPTILLSQARELDEKMKKNVSIMITSVGYPFFSQPPNLLPVVHSSDKSIKNIPSTESDGGNMLLFNETSCMKKCDNNQSSPNDPNKPSIGSSPTENKINHDTVSMQQEFSIATNIPLFSMLTSDLDDEQERKEKNRPSVSPCVKKPLAQPMMEQMKGTCKRRASPKNSKSSVMPSLSKPITRLPVFTIYPSYASSFNTTTPLSLPNLTPSVGWVPHFSSMLPPVNFRNLSDTFFNSRGQQSTTTDVMVSAATSNSPSACENLTNLVVNNSGSSFDDVADSKMLPPITRYSNSHAHTRLFSDAPPPVTTQSDVASYQRSTSESFSYGSGSILRTLGLLPSTFLSK